MRGKGRPRRLLLIDLLLGRSRGVGDGTHDFGDRKTSYFFEGVRVGGKRCVYSHSVRPAIRAKDRMVDTDIRQSAGRICAEFWVFLLCRASRSGKVV